MPTLMACGDSASLLTMNLPDVRSENCNSSPRSYAKTIVFNMAESKWNSLRSNSLTFDAKTQRKKSSCVNNATIGKHGRHSRCSKAEKARRRPRLLQLPRQDLKTVGRVREQNRLPHKKSQRRSMTNFLSSNGFAYETGTAAQDGRRGARIL